MAGAKKRKPQLLGLPPIISNFTAYLGRCAVMKDCGGIK
jgi:hypothetical protein